MADSQPRVWPKQLPPLLAVDGWVRPKQLPPSGNTYHCGHAAGPAEAVAAAADTTASAVVLLDTGPAEAVAAVLQ
jgi:hypothetical protein